MTPATTGTIERTEALPRYGTSWGAIWAGFFVALAVEIMWTTLGVGVGAGSIHPPAGTTAAGQTLGIWSAVWFFVETLIALFAGGWVAGKLAARTSLTQNGVHGMAVWGVTWLVLGYLLTTGVGSAFFAAADFLRGAFNSTAYLGNGAAAAISPVVGAQGASYIGYLLFVTLAVSLGAAVLGARMAAPSSYRSLD